MSVEIDPQELGFHRPFTVEVLENLKIRNPNTHPVAFKVKTTAPKQYCVRPNSGRVEPGKEVEVQVILQAMKAEPAPGTKCRDKFLVQSVAITGDKEFDNLASIWDTIDKSSIQEKKIRVVFLDPKTASSSAAAANVSSVATPVKANGADEIPDSAPPAYSSPGDYAASSEVKSEDDSHLEDSPSLAAAAASSATTKIKSSSSSSEQSYEELRQQLIQAERTIAQLKQDQSAGLRQRKGASEEKPDSKPAELAQAVKTSTEGVPLQITAILCLVSFLLAYIFF
ncbi:VAMP-associated protein [Xylariaceae sp. FL0255]|nr:VAMP-associated protein [Xylariaceae sp. FL0255]